MYRFSSFVCLSEVDSITAKWGNNAEAIDGMFLEGRIYDIIYGRSQLGVSSHNYSSILTYVTTATKLALIDQLLFKLFASAGCKIWATS